MRSDILSRLNELRVQRKAVVLITDLETGSVQLVAEGEPAGNSLDEAVATALQKGTATTIEQNGGKLFLNVYLPPVQIVVIGAVHISQALAPMARLAGFELKVIDPRSAFATPERFAGTDLVIDWPQDVLHVDAYTALAAVSHVPDIDDFPLAQALRTGCFYVGALGSRKSHAARCARLREQGISEEALARIHAPVGLDIGAANPAEIAVSILAEIIQSLRRRTIASAEAGNR
jgi:xanthine dehydrogenase accessory factor